MANFKLRNAKGKSDGPFSEKEVIARIKRGKVQVDDEVSTDPFVEWEKISVRTEFYDAFLRRLFSLPQGDDQNDDSSASKKNQSVPASQARFTQRHPDGGKTRAVDEVADAQGGTRNNLNLMPEGGTVHQSEIDELFSEAGGASEADGSRHSPKNETVLEAELGGTGTELMAREPKANTQLTIPFETQAFLNRDLPPEQDSLVAEAEIDKGVLAKKVRFRVFAALGAVLVLGMLLFDGGAKRVIPSVEVKKTSSELAPLFGVDAAAKTAALIKEADLLKQYDSPLFYRGAVEALKDAITLKDQNTAIFGRLAESLAYLYFDSPADEAGPLKDEVQKYIARGRQFDPHASAIYRAEAILLVKEQNWVEARLKAVAGIESDPHNPEGAVLLGEIASKLDDGPRSKLAFEEALKINPGLLRARLGLANIALAAGDITSAKGQANEALKISPFYSAAFLVLSRAARVGKDSATAQGMAEMAARYSRLAFNDVKAQIIAEIAGLTGQPTEGASLDSLAYGPEQFLEVGNDLEGKGRTSEATRFFLASSLLSTTDATALIRLGEAAEKVALSYEDYRYVMNIYERAIQRDTTQPKAYIRLGILETEQYNWDRAYRLLSQASALSPNKPETYVALGRYYYKKQDYLEALKQLTQAYELSPDDSEVQYYAGLIRLVVKKDAVKDAMPFFYQSYTSNPQNYPALVEWLKLKVLNYEKNFAVKFVRASLEKEPNNSKLYWALGEVYAANNEHHRAIEAYHKALDFDNRDSRVRMSLGVSLQAVGDLKNAIEEYRLASVLDRKNSEGLYKAADLLFQARSYNQSEELLRHLVSLTPNYPGAHRYLAKVHAVKRQKELAIEEMQKEVANNPENYRFVIELAELFMEYEMFDKAITELSRVSNLPSLTKSPQYFQDKVRAFLLLSRCFRAQSRNESAESSIKLALDLDANDPELHRELGYVYYALQRDKEGVKAFNFYLSRNPAATDGEVIRGLIQKMMIEE